MTDLFPQPEDIGLYRFGIISPLLHSREDDAPLHARIAALASREFRTPQGTMRRYSPDTLRDWLSSYRTLGLEGLRRKPRTDRGGSSVPPDLRDALTAMRQSQPAWTVRRILDALRDQGAWDGRVPGRSALYRYTSSHGLNRNAVQPAEPVRSFEYPFFGDLWTGDFLHGPKVRRGTRAYKAYLHAVIDDATRYIVVARFHPAENVRATLDDLMLAVRRFGVPRRFYTDNGSAFRSHHLRLVAARLGVALPHTPPYKPRGRGKIERFFRHVRESFLDGRARSTIEKLNADLAAWINQYHHRLHRTLGMTPLERKLADNGPALRLLSPTVDIDDIFRMEIVRRVGSDGCVRMFGRRFEVRDAPPGSRVTIAYLPWDQEVIRVGPDRIVVTPLDSISNARRFDKPRRGSSANSKESS
jgi:transposase InsO family protein